MEDWFDLEAIDENGSTPLLIASKIGHTEIVSQLIDMGADLDAQDNTGLNSLLIASIEGHHEIVNVLLEKGAYVHSTALIAASHRGHDKVVMSLLDYGADVHAQDSDGRSSLFYASQCGHTSVVNVLLQRGANPNAQMVDLGAPLNVACLMGHETVVTALLLHGADVNLCDKEGVTPLMVASAMGHLQIATNLLEKGATVDVQNCDGMTALMAACDSGLNFLHRIPDPETLEYLTDLRSHERSFDAVMLLIEHGADINKTDRRGRSAKDFALRSEMNGISNFFVHFTSTSSPSKQGVVPSESSLVVDSPSSNVSGSDSIHSQCLVMASTSNESPLMITNKSVSNSVRSSLVSNEVSGSNLFDSQLLAACMAGDLEAVLFALQHGAFVDAQSSDGYTALLTASYQGYFNIVLTLLKHGANVDAKSNLGATSLMAASYYGNTSIVSALLECAADVNSRDNSGATALMAASERGHFDVVKILLNCNADMNSQDNAGLTSLFYACRLGHTNVVRLLLHRGANPNIQMNDGGTSLLAASLVGFYQIVTSMLTYKANVNLNDKEGVTPLMVASGMGHMRIVKKLVQHGANIDAQSNNGITALMAACDRGASMLSRAPDDVSRQKLIETKTNDHIAVVQYLVHNGASIDTVDKFGKTAVDVALRSGTNDISDYIQNLKVSNQNCVLSSVFVSDQRFQGPVVTRKRSDLLFIVLLVASWVVFTSLGTYGVVSQNFNLLSHPIDYHGNICGVNNLDVNMTAFPKLLCINDFGGGVCVEKCPLVEKLTDVHTFVSFAGVFQGRDATLQPNYVRLPDYYAQIGTSFACNEFTCPSDHRYSWFSQGIYMGRGYAFYAVDTKETFGSRCLVNPSVEQHLRKIVTMPQMTSSSTLLNPIAGRWRHAFFDVLKAKNYIFGCGFVIAFALSILLIILLHVKIAFRWLFLLQAILVMFGLGGYISYLAGVWKLSNPPFENKDMVLLSRVFSYIIIVIGGLLSCFVATFRKEIQQSLKITCVSCLATKDMPALFLLPLLHVSSLILFWMLWMYFGVCIISAGKISEYKTDHINVNPVPTSFIDFTVNQTVSWFWLFCGIWTTSFLGALSKLTVSLRVSKWYFFKEQNMHRKCLFHRDMLTILKYHSGTAAVGAIFMPFAIHVKWSKAIVLKLQKTLGMTTGKHEIKVIRLSRLLLQCLEDCFVNISKYTYSEVSVFGTPFFVSSRIATMKVSSYFKSDTQYSFIASFIFFMERLLIAFSTSLICCIIMTRQHFATDLRNSIVTPSIAILLFAFVVADAVIQVVETCTATMIYCYIIDRGFHENEQNKVSSDALSSALCVYVP